MSPDAYSRGSTTGKVTDALVWVAHRRAPFTSRDLAEAMGCHSRTAHRYLLAFMVSEVVEARTHPADAWVWENTGTLRTTHGGCTARADN